MARIVSIHRAPFRVAKLSPKESCRPRIEHGAIQHLKIRSVASHQRKAMDCGGGGEESIQDAHRAPESLAAGGHLSPGISHGRIDREDASFKAKCQLFA